MRKYLVKIKKMCYSFSILYLKINYLFITIIKIEKDKIDFQMVKNLKLFHCFWFRKRW